MYVLCGWHTNHKKYPQKDTFSPSILRSVSPVNIGVLSKSAAGVKQTKWPRCMRENLYSFTCSVLLEEKKPTCFLCHTNTGMSPARGLFYYFNFIKNMSNQYNLQCFLNIIPIPMQEWICMNWRWWRLSSGQIMWYAHRNWYIWKMKTGIYEQSQLMN